MCLLKVALFISWLFWVSQTICDPSHTGALTGSPCHGTWSSAAAPDSSLIATVTVICVFTSVCLFVCYGGESVTACYALMRINIHLMNLSSQGPHSQSSQIFLLCCSKISGGKKLNFSVNFGWQIFALRAGWTFDTLTFSAVENVFCTPSSVFDSTCRLAVRLL